MKNRFRFGAWLVDPFTNSIETAAEKRQIEPRMMEVLVALCNARGAILSAEELLTQCWGSTLSGDSPLHKTIAHLRRVLGDNAGAPLYIETIRMRGYRTVAPLDFNAAPGGGGKNWQAGSPFRGLLAFDADHADVFFGRDDVTRKLVDAVAAQVRGGLALMLVLGPSGSGKTSLIQAGLIPALSRMGNPSGAVLLASTSFDLVDQGEQTLFTALAGTLLDLQWEDRWAFPGENAVSLGTRLESSCETVCAGLRAALAAHAQAAPAVRFGVFIDRFEALFNATRIDESERRAFLHTLEQLARSGNVLLIVACRNDFYPNIAQYPLLIEAMRHGGHFNLEPPGVGDFAQMIRRPAAAAKLTFGTDPVSGAGLDDILCASAADRPDALPLLQYCLQELYRLRTGEGELSFEAFHQLGDLEGAIGQRAEEVVLGLGDAERAALDHIMSLAIVLSSDGVNASSQRVPWAALRDDPARHAVAALVESRLFVSDLAAGTPVFGIAHDAILRRWPRMTDWIAAHRSALAARSRLAQHAGRWRDEGRRADLLLPHGTLLDEARELQQAGSWSLAPHERELIAMSHRRARERDRIRLCALVLIVGLALLATSLGVSALLAKRAAELRRSEAESLIGFMLGDFADKLRPLGRLDLLESVSGKALQYLGNSEGDGLSQAALTLRAKGLQIIAEVSRSRGDPKQALDALARAHAILSRRLQMAPRDLQVLKNLGDNAYWVGQIHKDQNNWQAAEAALRDYLKYADLLHRLDPDNPQWWVEQSYAHNNLGALAQTRGKPELAAPEFMASIALKQRALDRMAGSSSVAAELADSYSWLATARESLGQLEMAQQLYAQEMQLVRKLRERFPGESMWTYREVRALQHRALIEQALGMDAPALRDDDEAKRLFAPVVDQDRKNRTWQVELANLDLERLHIVGHGADAGDLLPQLTGVHRTLQTLLAVDPKNGAWARREALARTRVAAALQATGQTRAARRELDTALARLQGLYASNPSDLNARLALIEAMLLSASMQQQAKDYTSVMLNCRKVYGMIANEGPSTSNYRILDPWVRVNVCLQNQAVAGIAAKRLEAIGYREASFVQFMSNNKGTYGPDNTAAHDLRFDPRHR
jgi:DNA-binding winged helix-turn-helix (wHTH) protein/tetratricopeptide (TPR) repeat protein